MGHEKKLRGRLRLVAVCAAVSLLIALAGCSANSRSSDDLPSTHLDGEGAVALSHERCGGCHVDGQRGSKYFEETYHVNSTDLSYGWEEPDRLS